MSTLWENCRASFLRNYVLVFVLFCLSMSLIRMGRESYQVDFRAFYIAAHAAKDHLDPYRNNRTRGEQFSDIYDEAPTSRFIYPPSSLFVFTPFSHLSYARARSLWTLFTLAILGAWLIAFRTRYAVQDRWIVLAFLSLPVQACVERGQVDVLLLVLLVGSFSLRNKALAGVCLGLAVAIKIYPVVIVGWMFVHRRVQTAWVAAASAGALCAVAAWRWGPSEFLEFFRSLQHNDIPRVSTATQLALAKAGTLVSEGHVLRPPLSFMGGPNNPLLLAHQFGLPLGAAFVLAYLAYTRYAKTPADLSYYGLLLAIQSINLYLWTMGMVMYLPFCLLAAARLKAPLLTCLLFVPLFLPAAVAWHGVSLRFSLAVLLMACVFPRVARPEQRTGLGPAG